jgi:hypothetical protein
MGKAADRAAGDVSPEPSGPMFFVLGFALLVTGIDSG